MDISGNFSVPINIDIRSEEHTSELQSRENLVCRLLLRRAPSSLLFPYTTLFRSIIAPYVCLYSDPFIVRGVAVLHEELRVRLQRRQKFRIGHIHGSLQTIQWTSVVTSVFL